MRIQTHCTNGERIAEHTEEMKVMPRGVTISKSGRIYVIKRNNREVGYAQNKENARKRQAAVRAGRDY